MKWYVCTFLWSLNIEHLLCAGNETTAVDKIKVWSPAFRQVTAQLQKRTWNNNHTDKYLITNWDKCHEGKEHDAVRENNKRKHTEVEGQGMVREELSGEMGHVPKLRQQKVEAVQRRVWERFLKGHDIWPYLDGWVGLGGTKTRLHGHLCRPYKAHKSWGYLPHRHGGNGTHYGYAAAQLCAATCAGIRRKSIPIGRNKKQGDG